MVIASPVGAYFRGVQQLTDAAFDVPLDWLEKRLQRELTPDEKAQIEAMGGLDKLMERLKQLFDDIGTMVMGQMEDAGNTGSTGN